MPSIDPQLVVNTKAQRAASGFPLVPPSGQPGRGAYAAQRGQGLSLFSLGVRNTEHTRVQTQRLQNTPSGKETLLVC